MLQLISLKRRWNALKDLYKVHFFNIDHMRGCIDDSNCKKTKILVIVLIRLVVDPLITIGRDLSLDPFSEPFTQIFF